MVAARVGGGEVLPDRGGGSLLSAVNVARAADSYGFDLPSQNAVSPKRRTAR